MADMRSISCTAAQGKRMASDADRGYLFARDPGHVPLSARGWGSLSSGGSGVGRGRGRGRRGRGQPTSLAPTSLAPLELQVSFRAAVCRSTDDACDSWNGRSGEHFVWYVPVVAGVPSAVGR
jgi:hypothetical protein